MSEGNLNSGGEWVASARPWAFTQAELTAGLRRFTGDPTLVIKNIESADISHRSPSMARIRGLDVETSGSTGYNTFNLVLKEPQSTTRAGTAGEGLREVSIYRVLGEHLPVRLPKLLAAHPNGNWLVLDRLPTGRRPEKWSAADYLLATDQLVALHDRFWGLGEDLEIYSWLARPLDFDFNIHIQAAQAGAKALSERQDNPLGRNVDLVAITEKIIANADEVIAGLRNSPATLLHGEFWPGNVHIHANSSLTVFDWEQAAIGPGILDLLGFIQGSSWYFAPLPVSATEIMDHYRGRLGLSGAYMFKDAEWDLLWDYAYLWTFVSDWVDILSKTPDALLETRLEGLNEVVIEPMLAAAARRLS